MTHIGKDIGVKGGLVTGNEEHRDWLATNGTHQTGDCAIPVGNDARGAEVMGACADDAVLDILETDWTVGVTLGGGYLGIVGWRVGEVKVEVVEEVEET